MTLPVSNPLLPPPPREYDSRIFAGWVQQLELFFKKLNTNGPIAASTLNLSALPTSATGLRSGDVWHDTTTHVLKIVP